jgi:hypothetical protein
VEYAVYRFDRENGPFKIVKQGRRVFVDRDTLDRYLSTRSVRTVDAASEEPAATTRPEPASKLEREEPPATQTPASPNHRERTGCGQRHLVVPYRWPTVAFLVY